MMLSHFGFTGLIVWDFVLVAVVSIMCLAMAYLYEPKHKAFVLSLPIPSTIAMLSVGKQVDASNVLGLILLFIFTQGVRILFQQLKVPIVLSIILAAAFYCIAGSLLILVLPASQWFFWTASLCTFALGLWLYLYMPKYEEEQGFRSPMPLWAKLPIVVLVVFFLVVIKKSLGGFMTVFPMVGVIGAYEARYSLGTSGRQIAVLMVTMVPMICAIQIVQQEIGLGAGLVVGWIVFLCVLIPMTIRSGNLAKSNA